MLAIEQDLCDDCGHFWHGLSCERMVTSFGGLQKCGCPSQFKENSEG